MTGWSRPRKGRGGQRRIRGALFILSTFLVASAVIRIGDSAAQAFALPSDTAETSTPSPRLACETSEDLKLLLAALQKRDVKLKEQEDALRARLNALSLADQEITRKMTELTEAEEDLRQMVALTESAAENDVSQLTKVYEAMKPKQASVLFEEMDPVFAAGFLARMRPESAADILAGLSPTAAHGISVILAGRNANAPRK